MSAPPDFNRLARFYRWMEFASFGPVLWWCRCAFLGELSQAKNAVVLGDGDGRFTARLLQTNPTIEVDAVDASAAMLSALIRRAGVNAGRVRTHLADARDWRPGSGTTGAAAGDLQGRAYDLIVTHFFLDCLTTAEVEALARRLRSAAAPSVRWLVSEFAVPAGCFGRLIAVPLIAGLYRGFGWLTGLTVRALPNYASSLGNAGFALIESRRWLGGLLVSEIWSGEPVQSDRGGSRMSA